MEKQSLWLGYTETTTYPPLTHDIRSDVVVVGAGITGLTAALLLRGMGKRVVVIDQGLVGGGETGKTTAHLTEVVDDRYFNLIKRYGRENATLIAMAHRSAMTMIEGWVETLRIDCNYRKVPGYLYCEEPFDSDLIEKEQQALTQVGVRSRIAQDVPLPFRVRAALRVENQAQFHPIKYLKALALQFVKEGGEIYEKTPAISAKDGEPCTVETEKGLISADDVLVCTNVPVNNRVFIQTKLAAYRSYAIAATVKNMPQEAPGLFWDTAEPYHYIRTALTDGGERLLILGGADHKTGTVENTEACYDKLLEYMESHFVVDKVKNAWSGQIIETVDGLPFIGLNTNSKHLYVATGYSGNGMTYGTVAGTILTGHISGRKTVWEELFHATRVPVSSLPTYLSENKDFVKYFIGDNIRKIEPKDYLAQGEGAIITEDGKKVAIYRSESNEITRLSPVCPHLGCQVHFNKGEKTWDCPCHGSRFDVSGKVINGPAVSGLEPIKKKEGQSAA